MAETSPILSELQGHIGVVTLNRPDKFNCISRALADGLSAAVRSLEANTQCRVVLLNANGNHFCTGADLDEVLAARETRATLEAFIVSGHEALSALEHSRLPIVGVVHGLCLAGGLELMMACDVVIAAHSARFGDQHAQYGLIPGWGGTQRLPRLVGLRRALHLMYSAEWLDAVTANVVCRVHDALSPDRQKKFEACHGICADIGDPQSASHRIDEVPRQSGPRRPVVRRIGA